MTKTYYDMPDGSRLPITTYKAGVDPKLHGKKNRSGFSNVALPLKTFIRDWANGLPVEFFRGTGISQPAVRDVYRRIVWAQDMGQGYAAFSYETLGAPTRNEPTRYSRATAERAVKWLLDHGWIWVKTPKGWGVEGRKKLANQYRPNLWIFLNAETGKFNSPPYTRERYEWRENAARFQARADGLPITPRSTKPQDPAESPIPHGEGWVKGTKRQKSTAPTPHGEGLYPTKDIGSSPPDDAPEPDGPVTPPPSPPTEKVEPDDERTALIDSPERWDGEGGNPWRDDSRIDVFAQAGPMADYLGLTLKKLSAVFGGKDPGNASAQKIRSVHAQNEAWLNNMDSTEEMIEFLSYDGARYDENEDPIDPDTIIWLGSAMVVTGNLALTAESVVGFRYKAPM